MNFNKTIISVVLAAVILYFLLTQISFADLEEIWNESNAVFLILAFVFYVLIIFLRARRYRIILQNKLSTGELFNISSVHSFLNGILPARTGELSYFYFIHKTGKIGGPENIASLLIARIFDSVICACFILLSIFFVSGSIGDIRNIAWVSLAGFFIILFLSAWILFWGRVFLRILSRFPVGSWILRKTEEIVVVIEQVRQGPGLLKIFVYSVVIWFFIFLMIWLTIFGLGEKISFWQTIFVFALPVILAVLPVQPFGGFGTYEGSMALGLILLGFDKTAAIGLGFALHVTGILFALILAIVSYLIMVSQRNQSNGMIA